MTRVEPLGRLKAPFLGLFALTLGACAAQEADTSQGSCNPKSVGCSIAPSAGASSTGGAGNGMSGASSAGGDTTAGGTGNGASGSSTASGSGGDLGAAGTTSTIGGASGATNTGGSSGAGTVIAGAGGAAAGAPSGGAPSGGAPSGGAAGATNAAGAGGATNAMCTTPIPARTGWLATASTFSNACTDMTDPLCNPPSYAIDADQTTRFSTGTKQVGTEWLQVDLGASGTVDQVTLSISNNDYGRHIQIRMSNTSNDNAAAVLIEQDGVTGLQTFKFSAPKTARYVLISQTGMLMTGETSWWSVQNVTVSCT
jgi:F5/8 type C domain